jgi:hypothetical protein
MRLNSYVWKVGYTPKTWWWPRLSFQRATLFHPLLTCPGRCGALWSLWHQETTESYTGWYCDTPQLIDLISTNPHKIGSYPNPTELTNWGASTHVNLGFQWVQKNVGLLLGLQILSHGWDPSNMNILGVITWLIRTIKYLIKYLVHNTLVNTRNNTWLITWNSPRTLWELLGINSPHSKGDIPPARKVNQFYLSHLYI